MKGVSCQAWLYGELFIQCYATLSPNEDVMNCLCRSAFLVSKSMIASTPQMLISMDSLPRKAGMKMPSHGWMKPTKKHSERSSINSTGPLI
jgi:hypothetical protein